MKKTILTAFVAMVMMQSSFAAIESSGVSGSTEVVTYASDFCNSFKEANDQIKYDSRQSFRRTIYVDCAAGSDSNNGLSQAKALRSLKALEKLSLTAGDQILLKGGQTHRGTIELIDVNSNKSQTPIHIGSYGGSKATIDFAGYANGILIRNTSNVTITDLKMVGNGGPAATNYMYREEDQNATTRIAIFINPTTSMSRNITIDNVEINDVFFYNEDDANVPDIRPCRVWNSELNSRFGWGVRIIMGEIVPSPNSTHGRDTGNLGVDGLTIHDTRVVNISHTGFKLNGSTQSPVSNLMIDECSVIEVGGPGSQFGGVIDAVMRRCKTVRSGSRNDPRKWGRGSGMWTHNVNNFVFERNLFEGAEGIADCCGGHIDIASNNVVMQYNLSKNNAGGFVEILGRGNNNCYRYNISINDGWRNPSDKAQHSYWRWLEEHNCDHGDVMYKVIGKTGALLTVNGHSGNGGFIGPYRSYIYNNTVVCSPTREDGFTNPFVFEVSDSAEGTLVANNIYWIPAKMDRSHGVSRFFSKGEIIENTYNRTKATGELDENHLPIVRNFTDAEFEATDLVIKNNLYKLYDPEYPHAENALPTNEANDYNTHDMAPLGGDPGFKKSNDWRYAEDLIPSNAEVVNRGITIEKLKSDPTSYGVLPKLNLEYDFFGNPIIEPIVGACVVAE